MNWKRVIALGLLGITLGVGQSYGIDINIPGAVPSALEDAYQHYRIDPKVTRLMEQSIEKEIPAIRANNPNYDKSKLEADIYATKELNNAVMYSRTVLILRDNGSDIKFTAPYESGIGIARLDNTKDIYMYINTPGGSVSAGLAIVDTMNFIKSDVQTIVMGMAASMGTIIASSGAKGKRFMLPNAEYMIHQPMGGTGGGTQQTDMAIAAEHLLKTRNNLEKILAENSGQSIEKVHADAERDNWMSAQETLEYGFIDEIMANNKLG